jgi:hypothetical protein
MRGWKYAAGDARPAICNDISPAHRAWLFERALTHNLRLFF